MVHKCFISFKTEDFIYKNLIQNALGIDMIDKSLNEPIDSESEEQIMRKIREEHLSDSTVTIFLIGTHSAENSRDDQTFIKRELQASLYNGEGNTRNGILGVVLPDMYDTIYRGSYACDSCGRTHNYVNINDYTVIKEFSWNYYLPNPSGGCHWSEDDRYCILVKWDEFKKDPEKYIEKAFQKRVSPIADKVKVYP